MQIKKTRIEIVSETSTFLMFRTSRAGLRAGWCERCSAEVLWTVPATIRLLGISQLPEMGQVHRRGDEICSRSLIAKMKEKTNEEQ